MMARVQTVVVPKPEFDALVAEVERLRALLGGDGMYEEYRRVSAEVERLRDRPVPEWQRVLWDEIEKSQAEVERLRDQKRHSDSTLAQTISEFKRVSAEVERLRSNEDEYRDEIRRLRAQLEMYAGMPAAEVEAREAEVERLRAERIAVDKRHYEGVRALTDEVERLREEAHALDEKGRAQRLEIEWLRQQYVELVDETERLRRGSLEGS